MINPYDIIQHQSLRQTEALVVAHGDVQRFVETDLSPPPSSGTIPVPTSPTVPVPVKAA